MNMASLQEMFEIYNNQQMLFFYNNCELSVDWEAAYQELSLKWGHLSTDYASAIQLRDSLRGKIETLAKENQDLRVKKQLRKFHLPTKEDLSEPDSFEISQKEITIKAEKKQTSRIKKQGSAQTETKTDGHLYECTYDDCHKVYTSPVSMNLHIKMKHNGGTKKEREAYARILLEAEQRGQELPKMNINLPPNFLQQYRTSYQYVKKYSM